MEARHNLRDEVYLGTFLGQDGKAALISFSLLSPPLPLLIFRLSQVGGAICAVSAIQSPENIECALFPLAAQLSSC